METVLRTQGLCKHYRRFQALDGLDMEVPKGAIYGLVGKNGAGKTTTMNIITGYLSSTSGTVTIDGCEILEDPTGAKSKIGYLPEIPPLYPDMIVRKYLEFMFDLKKVTLPKKEHIEEVCKVARITDVAGRLIKNLSKGYKQRVGLAQALLGNPPVLILDEPTVGLDPEERIHFRNLRHIIVMVCVISHGVPFLHHALYKVRAGFQIISHHKESGFDIVCFQGVLNGSGITGFIARVERQVYFFL